METGVPDEQQQGVAVSPDAVMQAQQRKIHQLTDAEIMMGARITDLETALAAAQEEIRKLREINPYDHGDLQQQERAAAGVDGSGA
jgi:TolA-binding protein